MSRRTERARWYRLALITFATWSALGSGIGSTGAGWGRAAAATVTQFAWTNTTANAVTDLRLEIDTGAAVVAADAVFRFELSDLFGVPPDATIDPAPLAATMGGTFTTALAGRAITLTRNNDDSPLPQDTTLVFVLTGLETPLRAGMARAGSLVVSDATYPSVFALDLPDMLVTPGGIWNAHAVLSSTISGRATSLLIAGEPANAIPDDGSIVISLPDMYDSLPSAALENMTGVNGSVSFSTARNQMRMTRTPGSGIATAAAQQIQLRIAGIVHPLLEGPVGTYIRVDTLDGLNRLIDQTYVNISDVVLEKAQVVLSTQRVVVREGSQTASTYTLRLSAPPVGSQVTVLVTPAVGSNAAVAVSPTQVVFSAADWFAPATITVTPSDDNVARGDPSVANTVVMTHSIAEALTTEPTFAAVSSVQLLLEDDDIPLVQVSSRYAAVIEGLRNDTYALVLTSEPRSDVRIDFVPDDAFVVAKPHFVVFAPSAWNTPQQVTLVGGAPPAIDVSTTRRSRKTRVRHTVASTDTNFDAARQGVVVPQSDVLVYYEPMELDQCVESCRPGWFAFSNASSAEALCLTCPLGFFCSGGCAGPTACPAGTHSNTPFAASALSCLDCPVGSYSNQAGMATCSVCPVGASCHSVSHMFEPCPVGTWSAENDSQCHDCPAGSYNDQTLQGRCIDCPEGYYCPTGSTAPVLCTSGTVSVAGGSRPCGPCPAGYDCSAPPMSPSRCPDGSYSLQGESSCSPCPRGFACPHIDQPPQACSLGSTSAASSTSCSPCPLGHSCANASADPIPCALGSYSSSFGSAVCRACLAGYSCADPSYSPTACAQGTFSSEGDHLCRACPAGKYCPDPSGAPKSCPSLSYSLGSATSCTPCPIGSNCASSEQAPATCPDGQYSTDLTIPCASCPAGFYCPSPSSNPIACSQGSYSLGGTTRCTSCPYGFICASTHDSPVPCALGQVNNANSTACIQCPKGYECSPLRGSTLLCEVGTYSLDGDITCRPCPPGYRCPTTTDAPVRCTAGTFATGGAANCASCPGGYICPQLDGSMNAPCPVGTFAPGSAISCTSCPVGSACPRAALEAPVPCLAGSYSASASASCIPCPPGYACPDTKTSQRIQCPAGSYSTGGEATCTPCPAGYQCLLTNSSTFQPCSSGWYSPAGSAACIQCPRGYYCDTPGEMPKNCSVGSYSLNGSSSCIACSPGYECPRSDQLPQPCPVGYYSEGGVANCKSCRPGYKCSMASTNPTPPQDECPMGGYCNPATTFFLCPAGTFGNVTGGESVDHACAPCPEGYYCEMGSTPLTKQVCPSGYICPEATKRASQYPCPSGTFSAQSGQKSLDVCQVCPAGSYCEQGCDDPQSCPLGYFCLSGTKSANQYPCPAGTFSGPQTGLHLASQCQQCEIGSYCPEASSTPIKCPAGKYNPSVGSAGLHECLDCPPGWSCPQVGQATFKDRCATGYYCPSGTVVATAKPCPAGTYTESVTLIRAEDCTICPLRHACPQGTGGETQTMLDCGAGFFCPNGTAYAKQFPCLPGTWSSSTSLATAAECDVCPKGKYCTGGKSFIDGNCSPGYYCPLGTASATQFPCPIGTYSSKTWLFEPTQCDDCPPGYYCPAGSVEPIACKPGSYSSRNNTERVGPGATWPSCVTCPAGYFCIEASVTPAPCGKGKFSGAGSKACPSCEAGYFCSSDTTTDTNMRSNVIGWASPGALYGKCYNGTYCPPGSDSEPALETDAWPRGYYCPTATPQPMICPAGTYSNFTGLDALDDCVPTPAGYFSLEGALAPVGECAPGFYCPLRSSSRTQVPCPARYYLNRTRGQSEDDCSLCVAGSFCPQGSAYPIPCPPGSYCRTGVATPEPCPIGTYANASGLRQVEDCTLCSPGMYCDSTGLTVPRGPCDPGYYCTLGAYTSAPMNFESTIFGVSNRHTGAQCPQGAYCPLGSALPTLCPPGTFNNVTGLETEGQCVPCPAGQYCETPGLFLPTGDCFAGYFCTGGSSVSTQFPTPPGYFTNTGATSPTPCPLGQFNLHSMQQRCVDCPAGFYCGSPATIQPVVCPTGNYCVKNTAMPAKCPPGTFSGIDGLVAETQCEACPAGAYCDSYGLSTPSGSCFEGYVCTLNSPVANPVNQTFGFVCPAGHYCPQGSGAGVQCPNGTFRASTGGTNATACAPCPGGFYCGGTALTAPSGKCKEGYFCTSRASTASPTDAVTGDICPTGFYCEQGTIHPVQCAVGSFAREPGQSKCTPCLAGFYCDGLTTDRLFDCPMGYFCPPGTGATPSPCPVGTFGNRLNAQNVTECLACTPGSYCDSAGLIAPSGSCLAGFYCPAASENMFGKNVSTVTRPCPVGAYCPEKTHVPVPCPVGTYSNATGLAGANECTFCDEGSFCATLGLTKPTGLCSAGSYCKRNNSVANPTAGVTTSSASLGVSFGGNACPLGSYCTVGSVAPRLCPEGTYADEIGAAVCKACVPGHFCPLGAASYSANRCPPGYYCPEGTKQSNEYPCPPGTFGNVVGLQEQSQCIPAPGGMFVDGYAATQPTGVCKSGFYCSGGSVTSTPPLSATGGPCLPGTNCPEGSAVPIVCDAGSYCSSTNTDKALPCDEGFYCVQGSYTAQPTGQNNSLGLIGDVCSAGHYCPHGTSNPIPCPPGTFSGNTQNKNASACFSCSPGFLCSTSGIVKPFEKCPPGYICTGGEREATQLCPMGFECPKGSSQAQECSAGSFSDIEGLALCKLCPERYYCVRGETHPQVCPAGFYCPIGTPSSTSYPCLPGTFSNRTSLAAASECTRCPPGKYCSGAPPTDAPTGACAPGYFCTDGARSMRPSDSTTGGRCAGGFVCLGGAQLAAPIDDITGRPCDPGYYCPAGSSIQIRCPKGTYNSLEQQTTCTTCPPGSYCNTNATAPAPCPQRYYCPEGISEPILCPNGTFGHRNSLEAVEQCAACSTGKYCTAGVETASCAAGYYCKIYNDEPNPATAVNATSFDFGGPCPIGHYCPAGVLDPFPCPNFTARLETHGSSVDDCGVCPAGMTCEDGAVTIMCPRGSYCPLGKSSIPCPAGTYNPSEGRKALEDCLPCAAGKLCNRTGVIDPSNYVCPPGHYCLLAETVPTPCAVGTYRRAAGGRNASDCNACVGGSFCVLGTVEPVVCDNTTYCPVGSGLPTPCPGGSYCPFNSTQPIMCPQGFYCPRSSELPTECGRGFYCPNGSSVQLPCPLGYIGRETPLSGAFTTLVDACEVCLPGMYGADPKRLQCDVCLEGFVCLGATTSSRPMSRETENGYECPPGFYCPAGSSRERACPIGTYQPDPGASNSSFCRECPANSYQHMAGQSSCLPCSKSAYSSAGATKCTCVGSHRAFQMTDGYCICEPGYEFYDQDMILRSDEDDDVDCQPIVYDRCGSGQIRSDSGSCITTHAVSCDASCNTGTGTYVSSMGLCQCDQQPDLDVVCDKKCRDSATQLQVNSTTGELQLFHPSTGEIERLENADTSQGVVSKVSCTSGTCQLHAVAVQAAGFSGSYSVPPSLAGGTSSANRQRRLLSGDAELAIPNPMLCLTVGSGVLFDLSTPGSYPIYLKDSMLNTNPSFDYGAFRALATKVKSNASSVSAFAFSFTEAGTYVFGNSLNSAAKTVVAIMADGTSCPTDGSIVPLNEKNLISVSAKRRTDDLILVPDWGLIAGLLGGLFGMVTAIITGLYYFRTKSWTNSQLGKKLTGYRAISKQTDLTTMHSKGSVVATNPVASADAADVSHKNAPIILDESMPFGSMKPGSNRYEADLDRWDDEDLDVRELVDRLQFHHESVAKCFEDQKGDVAAMTKKLQTEAAELKRLFVNALHASRPSPTPADPTLREREVANPEVTTEAADLARSISADDAKTLERNGFLIDHLEHELVDRHLYEKRKSGALRDASELLGKVESWRRALPALASAIADEMALSVNTPAYQPESTQAARPDSHLEKVQSVLDDLQSVLCSDPSTRTSSSLVQIVDSERARREIEAFVLNEAQRHLHALRPDGERIEDASHETMLQLLDLHADVSKTHNRVDETAQAQVAALHKFGLVVPKVAQALNELEHDFRTELAKLKEEQNPSKERALKLQLENKLNKLLTDLSKGAEKVGGSLQKETVKMTRCEPACREAETTFVSVLDAAKKNQTRLRELEQKEVATEARARHAAQSTQQLQHNHDEQVQNDTRDKTLFQIKDLLVALTAELSARQQMGHGSVGVGPMNALPVAMPFVDAATDRLRFIDPLNATRAAPGDARLAAGNQFAGFERAAQTAALELVNAQAKMREQYRQKLETEFPQLQSDERERLVNEFAADLQHMASSASVDALRSQQDLRGVLTAVNVVQESQQLAVQTVATQHEVAIVQDRRENEEKLATQFEQEQLAIEQEYLQELSQLEQEFEMIGGDFADAPSDEDLSGADDDVGSDNDIGSDVDDDDDDVAVSDSGRGTGADDTVDSTAEDSAVVNPFARDAAQHKRYAAAAACRECEDELARVRTEREHALTELESALAIERQRQRDKLVERLKKQRVAAQSSTSVDGAEAAQDVKQELERSEATETERLERALNQQAARAIDEERERFDAREAELMEKHEQLLRDAASAKAGTLARTAASIRRAPLGRSGSCIRDNPVSQQTVETIQVAKQKLRNEIINKLHQCRKADTPQKHLAVNNLTDDAEVNSILSTIQGVHDAHDRTRKQLQERLDDEARLRKAQLADRLQHRRAELQSRVATGEMSPSEHARQTEALVQYEQEQRAQLQAETESRTAQLRDAVQYRAQSSTEALVAALADGTAELDRLVDECRQKHARDEQALREQLALDRQRQQQSLLERLAKRREQLRSNMAASGASAEDVARAERELDSSDAREQRELDAKLRASEQSACAEREQLNGREVLALIDGMAQDAQRDEACAKHDEQAALDELARVRREHEAHAAALRAATETERQRQSLELAERLRKRRDQRLQEVRALGASDTEALERVDAEERLEQLALEGELAARDAASVLNELERQRVVEQALGNAVDDAALRAAQAEAARKARERAHALEAERVQDAYRQQRGELADDDALRRQQQKRALQDRLAARRTGKPDAGSGSGRGAGMGSRSNADLGDTEVSISPSDAVALLSTIQGVHDAHDRTRKQLQERLDDEARLRKAQLADRLQHRRAELQSRVATGEMSPSEHARQTEALVQYEQEQRAQLQAETESRTAQLRDAVQYRAQSSTEALVAALADGTAELDRLVDECRQKHARDEQALREQLALDRQRQQQSLLERLAKRREQLRSNMAASGASAEDVARAERELDSSDAREQRELDAKLRASEQSACAEREQLNGREVLALIDGMAQDAQRDEACAKHDEQAALDELARVRREHEAHAAALRAATETERQRQSLELAERLRKRRDQRLQEVRALGASDTEALERVDAEERLEQLALEGELAARDAASVLNELERQRVVEQALGNAVDDAALRAAQAEAARKARERAHALEAERVQDAYRQQRGELADDDALRRQQQKRALQDRLAARRTGKPDAGSGSGRGAGMGSRSNADLGDRLDSTQSALNTEAPIPVPAEVDDSMEREIQRVKDAHGVGWQAQVRQFELDASLKRARLADRIAKKRAALAVADASTTAAAALEREESEALAVIAMELDGAKQQVQSALAADEQVLCASVDAAAKAETDELERLLAECKRAHADETANLCKQQALERQQREQSLQERLAKRRAQKLASHASSDQAKDALQLDESDRRELEQLEKARAVDEAAALAALEMRQRAEVAAVMAHLDDEAARKREAALAQQQSAEQQLERLQAEHSESLQGLNDSLAAQRAQQESKLQQRLLSRRAKKQDELDQRHADANEIEHALRELDDEQAAQQLKFDEAWETEIARKIEDEAAQQREREHEVAARVRQAALDAAAADAARKAVEAASRAEANRVASEFAAESAAALAQQSVDAESQRRRLQDRLADKKQKRADQKLKRVTGDAAADNNVSKGAAAADTDDNTMRLEREREVQALAQQAEAVALQKQADAQALQQQAQRELERLKGEHEVEMKSLNASLLADQRRQEQKLQERIAQRRERKHNEAAAASASDKERERLAAQLENDERDERLALEQAIAATAARAIEDELERQHRKEAELAARIDEAAAAAEAAEVARRAVEAAREVEIARLSKEFDEKSRELRQSNQADLAAQKQKLEMRIAAKRQKKLRELEAKKELELQRLRQHEADALEALEANRVKVEHALETFATSGDGDAASPLDGAVRTEREGATVDTSMPPQAAEVRLPENAPAIAMRAQQQQAIDVAATEQLFALGLIPQQMSLLAGVELVVSQRHQLEAAALLATQHDDAAAAMRDGVGALMQRKASAKARALGDATSDPQQREQQLRDIDSDFDAQIRALEQQLHTVAEATRLAQTAALKRAQLAQIELLLTHFAPHHAAAVARLHAQQQMSVAAAAAAAAAAASARSPRLVSQTSSRVLLQSSAERDDMDLVDELRARLEVEKHERLAALKREKGAELATVRADLDRDVAALATRFEQLVACEVAEVERTFQARLDQLPVSPSSSSSSRPDAMHREFRAEKDAQVARLVLMLRGRQAKQTDRLQRLATKRAALVEHEYARKADEVTAAMLQRIVAEKETLTQKQKLIRGNGRAEVTTPAAADDADTEVVHESMLVREVDARLARIEELLECQQLRAKNPDAVDDDPHADADTLQTVDAADPLAVVSSYRTEITDAVARGCRHTALLAPVAPDLSAEQRTALHAVTLPADAMSASMRARLDFVTFVLQLAAPPAVLSSTPDSSHKPSLAVVVVRSLEAMETSSTDALALVDGASETLFLCAAGLLDLSTGQLAILGLHALAQLHTRSSDVSSPLFVAKVYELLVQCYQSLFHANAAEQASLSTSSSAAAALPSSSPPVQSSPQLQTSANSSSLWQSRLHEMETFLSTLERSEALSPSPSAAGLPSLDSSSNNSTAIERNASMRTLGASTRSLLPGRHGPTDVEQYVHEERKQLVQEKLDAAEKLYTQVLRQYQEQKESLEYLREMLTDEQEQEQEESASSTTNSEQGASASAQTQHEVAALEAALTLTRKERDELFAQCQALRDDLR